MSNHLSYNALKNNWLSWESKEEGEIQPGHILRGSLCLNYYLSACFQTSHGSGTCCYHILLTTNVPGKKPGYTNKKIFLLDQIYEQHRSKNSIERAKCEEIPNVKAADPSNVLQR